MAKRPPASFWSNGYKLLITSITTARPMLVRVEGARLVGVAAWAAHALFTRLGRVHLHLARLHRKLVKHPNGLGRVRLAGHGDKCKPLGLAGVAVLDQVNG